MSSFCTHCKSYSHFFSKKFQHICISLDVNFNKSLTNDVVRFEQLGPGSYLDSPLSLKYVTPFLFVSDMTSAGFTPVSVVRALNGNNNFKQDANLMKWFGTDMLKTQLPNMPPLPAQGQRVMTVDEIERS